MRPVIVQLYYSHSAAVYVLQYSNAGGPGDCEAVAMIFGKNRKTEKSVAGQINLICTFVAGLAGGFSFTCRLME